MSVTFDLETGAVLVRCNYRHQLEAAIVKYDPFHWNNPAREAIARAVARLTGVA
jgi:hypothetical protein